jgi:hypothetical protein
MSSIIKTMYGDAWSCTMPLMNKTLLNFSSSDFRPPYIGFRIVRKQDVL